MLCIAYLPRAKNVHVDRPAVIHNQTQTGSKYSMNIGGMLWTWLMGGWIYKEHLTFSLSQSALCGRGEKSVDISKFATFSSLVSSTTCILCMCQPLTMSLQSVSTSLALSSAAVAIVLLLVTSIQQGKTTPVQLAS